MVSGINAKQLQLNVIRPALKRLDLHSEVAELLVLGTAAQESAMGTYIKQLGRGPAVGIFQMEPATHDDIWDNYLRYKGSLSMKVRELIPPCSVTQRDGITAASATLMTSDMMYAAAMCRIHYLRVPSRLPETAAPEALAQYWKKYYNTPLGRGTEHEFVKNYARYISLNKKA